MKYKVVSNSCGCHPETCCCPDYRIIDEEGNRVAGGMDDKAMEKLVKQANKNNLIKVKY